MHGDDGKLCHNCRQTHDRPLAERVTELEAHVYGYLRPTVRRQTLFFLVVALVPLMFTIGLGYRMIEAWLH